MKPIRSEEIFTHRGVKRDEHYRIRGDNLVMVTSHLIALGYFSTSKRRVLSTLIPIDDSDLGRTHEQALVFYS